MKKRILLIMLMGMSFGLNAQEKIQTEIGLKSDFIYKNGNIGIGTTNPQQKLQIGNNGFALHDGGHKVLTFNPYTTNFGSIRYDVGGKRFTIETIVDGSLMTHMHIASNGDVIVNHKLGIGTWNPGTWKLAVNGNIRAKEIKVETEWSDFVFEKDYDLPTLAEVENHIKAKGHLKDIPSAEEVAENGIFLGEMDSKLLRKIEELTLYTIQQEKRLENLESKNKKLEEENKALKTLNSKLFELQKRLEKLEQE
ncbi:hypothetical protein [Ascidiimonas aurantiaca]|uniref:hypothetical protein n=1 Tax=Ascidiimonas aurantiaca TaxID=1685432 RepID=UPI0030EC8DF6